MWIIVAGPAQGVPVSSLPVCLEKMKLSFRDVHSVLEGALTYPVPVVSADLPTLPDFPG